MSATHTPGPWTVADRGPSDLYILATAPRALIGRVDTDDRADRREAEADARLIAAAPDLRELLELGLRVSVSDWDSPHPDEWARRVREVLARVDGAA